MTRTFVAEFVSPVGAWGVAERDGLVVSIHFGPKRALTEELARIFPDEATEETERTDSVRFVERVFHGESALDAPIDWSRVVGEFDRMVLRALVQVPLGETIGYGELARRVGSPGAARAVGSAMRRNRFPLLVPCHRVLPASGALGHYSGGGPEVKRWLLELEAAKSSRPSRFGAPAQLALTPRS